MLRCPSGVGLSVPGVPGALCSAGGLRLECPSRCSCLGKQRAWLSYCLPRPLLPALLPSCPSWNAEDSCLVFRDVPEHPGCALCRREPTATPGIRENPCTLLAGFVPSQYSGCWPQSFQRVKLLLVPVLGVLSPCKGAQSCESSCSSH